MGIAFREAESADLPTILHLLADDVLGKFRERSDGPPDECYVAAFRAIAADPNHSLIVAEIDGEIAGMFQLSFLPGLSRKGSWRGQIESVRVASHCRNRGIGHQMMLHAIAACRTRGCSLIQLTSDKRRGDAHRFYGRLGFVATHEGYKLAL